MHAVQTTESHCRPEPRERSDRRAAAAIGGLFATGTVALMTSFAATGGVMGAVDPIAAIAAQPGRVVAGALLVIVSGLALGLVPVVFWPIGRRHGETLSAGYLVVRGAVETGLYLLSALCWLLVAALAGRPDAAGGAALVLAADGILWAQLIPIPFVLGALLFNSVLFRSRLVPRWLSAWGLVGAVLYLGGPLGAITGLALGVLMAPLALQEMVLAARLIARGFAVSAAADPESEPGSWQVAGSAA